MATKTYFINSTQAAYTDEEFAWLQSLFLSEGLIGDENGDIGMEVAELDTPGLGVQVSVGKALVEITKDGRTFKVVAESDAITTLAVAPNSSGNNRIDAVILRVDVDAEPNVSKSNIATIEVVTGDDTSPLSDGDIDTAVDGDGWYRLADVTVADSAVSILDASVADTREKVVFNDAMGFSEMFIDETTGVPDAGKFIKLDAGGKIDTSFLPDAAFGNGSDGAVTLNGSTDYTSQGFGAPAANVYTMTRDVYCTTLTINSGITLRPAGYRIFCSVALTGAGKIQYNGSNGNTASGNTAGSGAAALSTSGYFVNTAGGNGTNGGSSGNNASTASTPSTVSPSIGVAGVRGGRGGGRNDSSNTTPTAGAITAPVFKFAILRWLTLACLDLTAAGAVAKLLASGGGSGGSGGNGYTSGGSGAGGGGGGAGSSGGIIFVAALLIAGTITFEAIGGNGGNGVDNTANGGGGGGGAGGAGGVVIMIYSFLTWTGTSTVTGGTGGTAGTKGNSPNIPEAGTNGNTGVTYQIPLSSLL